MSMEKSPNNFSKEHNMKIYPEVVLKMPSSKIPHFINIILSYLKVWQQPAQMKG